MPLLPIPIDLPPHFVEATAGDVDGDGRRELVLVSERAARPGEAAAVTLTVVHLSEAARIEAREEVSLGREATWWSPEGPLLTVTGAGLSAGGVGDRAAVWSGVTPLAGLGATTPRRGAFAEDLDGDGLAEAWVYSQGSYHVIGGDGRALGRFKVPSQGALADRSAQGGRELQATVRLPPVSVADADGDGVKDLLVPSQGRLLVQLVRRSGEGLALGELQRWSLPRPLVSPEDGAAQDGAGEREVDVTDVDLRDIDGDGVLDLLVHEVVSEGSFFGATAELCFYRGQGQGFVEVQRLKTGTGSTEVDLFDLDGDGDLDAVLGQVDVSFSNLARGLVSRSIEVGLARYDFDGGRFADEARPLQSLSVDLEDPSFAWTLWGDFDRDGAQDLAWVDDETLNIRLSSRPGQLEQARLSVKVEQLTAHDLTGDGAPELLAWAEGEARATLFVLQ